MKFYIIYDRVGQILVRGIFTSYNKAIKAQEELNESVRQVNDIYGLNNRFVIKKIDANRTYYY